MIRTVKERFLNLMKRQDGFALPAVLAMFVIGSLLIVPSINHVATNLKAGTMAKEDFKGMLAADAGVEDALWKIKNDTPVTLPYEYQIPDVNGLSVDITIEPIEYISGQEIGSSGGHEEWIQTTCSVVYDADIYYYTMALTNETTKNIKIVKILIDFPPGVDYVDYSTSSNVTDPLDADPTTISGIPGTGITLVWENLSPPGIQNETKYHLFELSGPPGIAGVEGHGFVEALSQDVGTLWISDVAPYSITAEAKDASEEVVATIRAGVWNGNVLEISCWQVIP